MELGTEDLLVQHRVGATAVAVHPGSDVYQLDVGEAEPMAHVDGGVAVVGHGLEGPVTLPFELPTPIYGAMLAIWHFRPALQRRFPLHKGRAIDYLRYLAWCAVHGRRQYAVLRHLPGWDAALAQPPALAGDSWAGGYSVAMWCYGLARYQYPLGPLLRDVNARHRIARAYWRGERHKFQLPAPMSWQYADLARRFGDVESLAAALRLPRRDGDTATSDLIDAFGLHDVAEASAAGVLREPAAVPVEPARLPGDRQSPKAPLPPKRLSYLLFPLWHLPRRSTEFQLSGVTGRIPVRRVEVATSKYPLWCQPLRLCQGRDRHRRRRAAGGVRAGGAGRSVLRGQRPAGAQCVAAGRERRALDHTEQPRYAVNLFCTTGIEQTRYACEQRLEHFQGRYNIGMWPWGLPLWPASCEFAFNMVDEIWGISRYTAGWSR